MKGSQSESHSSKIQFKFLFFSNHLKTFYNCKTVTKCFIIPAKGIAVAVIKNVFERFWGEFERNNSWITRANVEGPDVQHRLLLPRHHGHHHLPHASRVLISWGRSCQVRYIGLPMCYWDEFSTYYINRI